MTTCPECGGKGRAWYETTVYVPPGIAGSPFKESEMECELCRGSGLVDEETAERYDP